LWERVDRRVIRSATYASLIVVLFVLFKTSEWLVEHHLSGSKDQSVIVGLAIALALAILFQMFHRRVEHAIERRLNRGASERFEGLKALAQEITLIKDRIGLQQRVVDRLESLLATSGAAIYMNEQPDRFSLACSTSESLPREISAQDPAVIHLRLKNEPMIPKVAGSKLSIPLLWPMRVHGRLIGFLASGERRHKESFDADEIRAVSELTQSVGTSLALIDPALADSATAGAALQSARDNLPVHLPPLIGREQELAEVIGLLGATSLFSILGVGGMGKTRLSLEIAGKVRDRFPHGVWFVELAPRSDPALVVSAVAEAVSVREEPGRPLLMTLLKFLGTRQLLIVLDNCEHLVEACARFAEAVLRGCSGVRILATSREPLNIAGELEWRVPPLETPDPNHRESTDRLNRYSAVRLFLARANAVEPKFRMTDANAAAIASICRRLDGIPLAIELAASRVKALGVEQLAERLDDRFRILTGGNRTALPRHQTLRSLIDWSYGLLNERERAMFCRLSVFAGGWTLDAAETVCTGEGIESSDAFELLSHLVEKSLVVANAQATPPRYHMLETIRQYAGEKLAESHDAESVSERHLAFFLSFAEAARPHFYHPDQSRWYATADAELDNVRAALQWSLAHMREESGMRLANGLHRYWVARLYWREASGWYERLLGRPVPDTQNELRARTLYVSGHIANWYDPITAQRLTQESLQMSRALDFKQGIVDALWIMGWIRNPRLDESATPFYEESIELANAIDYVWGAVHAYAFYGAYKVAMGEYEAAKPLLLTGVGWGQRIGGDASLIGRCKGNLGQAEMLQGNFAKAHTYLDESLALERKANNQNSIAESLWLLGRLALHERDHARAVAYFKESLALYRPYATSQWVTKGLAFLVIAYAASDQLPLAAQLAGVLAARDGGTEGLKADLGSLAAIAEYEAAVADIRRKFEDLGVEAAWDAGTRLDEEAAIALALEETSVSP
jgi:non-specific serine/threonine protein kinase